MVIIIGEEHGPVGYLVASMARAGQVLQCDMVYDDGKLGAADIMVKFLAVIHHCKKFTF